MTTASTAGYPAFRDNRFFHWICAGIVAILAITAYHPDKVFDWFLENAAVTVTLIGIFLSYRRMPFSDLSFLLMFVYLCIHEYGAHYKYSDVPVGEWLKPLLHTTRNHYDRISHFSFGLFLAYPIREIAMRKVRVTGKWLYLIPVESILAISAIYEMFEALMASILSPERGEEFVGMQGDMWDSQKDMFDAGVGALVALLIIATFVNRRGSNHPGSDQGPLAVK